MISVLAYKVKESDMPGLAPESKKIKINQHVTTPDRVRVDACEQLVIVLPEALSSGRWPDFPYGELLKKRLSRARRKECGALLLDTTLPNAAGTEVVLGCVKAASPAFERLTLARRLAERALANDPGSVSILLPGLEGAAQEAVAEALAAALLAAAQPMPRYRSKEEPPRRLHTIELLGLGRRLDLRRTVAEAEGNHLARWLTALPANELTPGKYRRLVQKLARRHGWSARFLGVAELKRRKAGAFLAVAQGSPEPDAGILHLRYRPARRARRKAVALVGKGICFDTGGTNLKPARYMLGMHGDMEGSAVALGTLLALTRLKADFPVDCWLALAQNHIGPRAYKPNDVVTAADGTTIEVVHTDAEGRMVLADTLALAAKQKPGLILDYATLTGSCIHALGTRYSGAFTNRPGLVTPLIEAGRASGERIWPFPTDEDYDEPLESEVADVKQCILEAEADHILAARFLNRFVPDSIPWVHLDLAAGTHKGGLAHIPTEITGFGVRLSLHLLLDRQRELPWS